MSRAADETVPVLMPQMGESLAEGTLVRWLKRPGDRVERDEPLFEIATDKVDTEVSAPVAGILREILVGEGHTVAVHTPVAIIEPLGAGGPAGVAAAGPQVREAGLPPPGRRPAGDATSHPAPGGASGADAGHFRGSREAQLVSFPRERRGTPRGAPPADEDEQARTGRPVTSLGEASRTQVFSPAVLEAARRAGLPLAQLVTLAGSGRGGRITKRDVAAFLAAGGADRLAAAAPAAGGEVPAEYVYRPRPEDRRVPMSPVRRKIAHHMQWSVRISPHATAFGECDMGRAAALLDRERARFAAAVGAPLTYTVLVARAALQALKEFPVLNSSIVGDELVFKPHVHLGVAVALADADELVVPVVHHADELSLAGLARAIHDLAERARTRRLTPGDVQGGTFTLTNPGIFGGLGGTPLLPQPQVAILGLGAIVKRPVVVGDDAIAVRPVMTMSLTFDHRATDGMVAFRYLARVRDLIEGLPDVLDASG